MQRNLFGKLGDTTHPLEKLFNMEKDNVLQFEYGQCRMPLGNTCTDPQWVDVIRGSGSGDRDQSTWDVLEALHLGESNQKGVGNTETGNVGDMFVR